MPKIDPSPSDQLDILNMAARTQNWTNVSNHQEYDSDIPLLLMGSYNTIDKNINFLRAYLQKFYQLELVNDLHKPTTQEKTSGDLIFSRGIQII